MSRDEKRSVVATATAQLAGSGALFIAAILLFGFLSLRAHENMLGLPVSVASSYLDHVAAGARFLIITFLAATFLAVCVIVLLPLLFGWSWLQRRKLVPSHAPLAAAARRPLLANALLLALLLVALWLCLGPLEQLNLLFRGTPRSGGAGAYFALETVVLLCIALSIAVIRLNRHHRYGTAFSVIIGIVLAALILLLPIGFGILASPTAYSRVHALAGEASRGEIYFIGFDARGNWILYNRANRTVNVMPANGSIVLGEREDILQ